jgi:capsule polysaccharide modification protein KpsS
MMELDHENEILAWCQNIPCRSCELGFRKVHFLLMSVMSESSFVSPSFVKDCYSWPEYIQIDEQLVGSYSTWPRGQSKHLE